MDKNAQLMFDYLSNVLYSPSEATLDINLLDEPFRELGTGLAFIGASMLEAKALAQSISVGNLDVELPSPSNELAAPLKNLHASLKHMTWQTQQVAKGDYNQRVEFLGDFAEAFNEMTAQLDRRQKALVAEIESGRKKTLALEQSNSLFEALTAKMAQWIIVMDLHTHQPLYQNNAAVVEMNDGTSFSHEMRAWLAQQTRQMQQSPSEQHMEISEPYEGLTRYLAISIYPLQWYKRKAVAFMVADVSKDRRQMQHLENVAFRDNLT